MAERNALMLGRGVARESNALVPDTQADGSPDPDATAGWQQLYRDWQQRGAEMPPLGDWLRGAGSEYANALLMGSTAPEFKGWFGNSVMRSKGGDPLTLYHGTNSDFQDFNGPAYFTYDKGIASDYSSARRGPEGGHVIEAHIKMENPATSKDLADAVTHLGLDPHNTQPLAPFATDPHVMAYLKSKGFDGVKDVSDFGYRNDFEDVPVVVPFSPKQIWRK